MTFPESITLAGGAITYLIRSPRDPDMAYMGNSIMFVEDAIYDATYASRDNANMGDDNLEIDSYDQVIPYMTGAVPTLQFADSNGGYVLPEFYLEYPIFVSTENYDSVKNEYHHIYKVYDGSTEILQLIPVKFAWTRTL